MRRLHGALLTTAAVIGFTSIAFAADLPTKGPVYKAPAVAPVPAFSWTGCYIGANAGGAWAHKEFSSATSTFGEGSIDPSNVAGGVQLGCDYQIGAWVVGAQGMFDWTNTRGQDPFFSGKAFSTRIPWFATATGRIGYAVQPSVLVFVKGGVAFIRDKHQFVEEPATVQGSADVTRTGWTIGGGADWMVVPNWSVSIEYGYMDFGTNSVRFQSPIPSFNFSENVKQHFQVVLVSLNYRFGSWGTH